MFYVFSYGSNLLFKRIQRRVYSVEKVRNHALEDFELVFNKRSVDGSTKANLRPSKGAKVLGVIHRMPMEHKEVLDEYEALGNGYDYGYFDFMWEGQQEIAHYYMAHEDRFLATGAPYRWYLDYVIYGAIENGFDPQYVEDLRRVHAKPDHNDTRRGFNDQVLEKYR